MKVSYKENWKEFSAQNSKKKYVSCRFLAFYICKCLDVNAYSYNALDISLYHNPVLSPGGIWKTTSRFSWSAPFFQIIIFSFFSTRLFSLLPAAEGELTRGIFLVAVLPPQQHLTQRKPLPRGRKNE